MVVVIVTLIASFLVVALARGIAAGKRPARVLSILLVAAGFIVGNVLFGATVLANADGLPALLIFLGIAFEWIVLSRPPKWHAFSKYFLGACAIVLIAAFALNIARVSPARLVVWEVLVALFAVLATYMYEPSVRDWFRGGGQKVAVRPAV